MKKVFLALAIIGLLVSCKKDEQPGFSIQAVDLGLSVKWANANIGASSIEDYGGYYAWGVTDVYYTHLNPYSWHLRGQNYENEEEVEVTWKPGKEAGYFWSSYEWANYINDTVYPIKYTANDGKMTLDPEDDVAHVKLGGNWRIPTKEEFQELIDNCNWTWTQKNGIPGYEVSSKVEGNNNSIFIPADGGIWKKGNKIFTIQGLYWANTYNSNSPRSAYCLKFTADNDTIVMTSGKYRPNGFPIRAVTE